MKYFVFDIDFIYAEEEGEEKVKRYAEDELNPILRGVIVVVLLIGFSMGFHLLVGAIWVLLKIYFS